MYVIRTALPRWAQPLGILFAVVGMIGCLPAFQTNQLVEVARVSVWIEQGWLDPSMAPAFNLIAGIVLASVTAIAMAGGLRRIATIAAWLVPTMSGLYLGAALAVLIIGWRELPAVFALILRDAFAGDAVVGGTLIGVITTGVQRGAFSNEAGIGTEALAHGSARTREPIREGLVAMVGPIVDTLLICSATALVILATGTWQADDGGGVSLTMAAFKSALGPAGAALTMFCVVAFASTTILTYSWYGATCFGFLFGARRAWLYQTFYAAMIVVSATVTLETAIGIIDGCYAIMAIPTMVSTLWLAPRVVREAERYWKQPRATRAA